MNIPVNAEIIDRLRDALPTWCMQYEYACFLDSNSISSACGYDSYEWIAGVGNISCKVIEETSELDAMQQWMLGYCCYESHHRLHDIAEPGQKDPSFKGVFFFQPEILLVLRKGAAHMEVIGADASIVHTILNCKRTKGKHSVGKLLQETSKQQYIQTVQKIREHIAEGDFYEMNYCMEFHTSGAQIAPDRVFAKLNGFSPTPFACFYKQGSHYLICASPERFLKREGEHIIAQPIKGTERRNADHALDEALKSKLQNSIKERAENVMIVDLMRNDLSRCSQTGTVQVDELFGIYTFATVHQMISTVSASLRKDIRVEEILNNTFPMGSMTGAPKRAVIHAVAKYESTPRGLFSGSVGYMDPNHDLDLNVVIRSIVYHEKTGELSFHVGSAITYDSDPVQEYEECLLKAQTMFKALDISPDLP